MEAKVTMVVLLITFLALIKANEQSVYTSLYNFTEKRLRVVEEVKRKVTNQTQTSNVSTIQDWYQYFGVSNCWTMSLTDNQRLDDVYERLKILRKYAVKLNISQKGITIGLRNLYTRIYRAKNVLNYPKPPTVSTSVIGHFNATTNSRKQLLVHLAFLTTLETNLRLMREDFDQKQKRIQLKVA